MDNGQLKRMLQQAVQQKRQAKSDEDFQKFAGEFSKELAGKISPDEMSGAVVKNLSEAIQPVLEQLLARDRASAEDISNAISQIKLEVPQITMPEMKAPVVNVPAPIVNVPAPIVNIPETKFPEYPDFPTEFSLRGVDKLKPLPVMMMDSKGKPAQFGTGGATGGRGDFFTIRDIQNSSGGSIIDADGFVKVTGNFSVTAAGASSVSLVNADGTYYDSDNPLPVTFSSSVQSVSQVSGAAWSVVVNEIFGSTATNVVNPDGRLKVELPTGSSGLTDTELRASSVPVAQASGASWSTAVTSVSDVFSTTAASTVVNPDNRVRVELPATSVTVTSVTNSTQSALIDSSGVQYSGSNPVPVTNIGLPQGNGDSSVAQRTVIAGDASASVNILTFNSNTPATGLNETTAGVLRTVLMTDSIASVFVTGAADSFAVYEATTTNPTAKADGADVRPMADDLGRQVFRPIHVRDLIATAYVALTNGTETTLTTAAAGTFRDLVMITATNNSSAATQLDIRATSGGNIVHTMYLPATTGPIGFVPSVPWPQDATGNSWTIDMPDQTGTTVYVSALFSTEV